MTPPTVLWYAGKHDRKTSSSPQCALYHNRSALPLHNGLCKRQSQPDALCVRGLAASVKPLKNMVEIFRGDAVAIVGNMEDCTKGRYLPCDADDAAGMGVVKRIFDKIAHRFTGPRRVTQNGFLSLIHI